MRIYREELRRARVEIIPMIDTIFFLLVYYMFVTMQMVHMSAMNVSIPKPPPPTSAIPPKCHVNVDAAGRFSVDGAPVVRTAVADAVRKDVARDPNTLVIITVASTQTVQPLIDCLDAVNEVSKPDGSEVNTVINGQGGAVLPSR